MCNILSQESLWISIERRKIHYRGKKGWKIGIKIKSEMLVSAKSSQYNLAFFLPYIALLFQNLLLYILYIYPRFFSVDFQLIECFF